MKGWDDRIAELSMRGRVRDTFDKPKLAREWNTGNCEPVRLTSGGVEGHANQRSERLQGQRSGVAQVEEHCSPIAEVAGSSPATDSTSKRGVRATPIARTVGVESGPLTLPWPPSGNTAVRHANGAHYLRPEVTAYRQTVAVQLGRTEPVTGRYEIVIELSPPDKRTRDIDNVLKSLLDALVQAGWLPSDSMSYMRKLTVTVRPDYTGTVYVRALADREAA